MTIVVFHLAVFDAVLLEMERTAPRAAMWAMREVGRHVVAAARVYEQPHNLTGALAASIKASRDISPTKGLTVAPRGLPASYAGKIERLTPFMGPASAQGAAEFPTICEDAMSTAFRESGA